MQCLLTMDCIPAGMELFPAADESVWDLIKSVIKESDYYVLIIGGRYGSTSKDNPFSYTHREFRLACDLKVPVLAFLHGDPGMIPQAKTDLSDDARQALNAFREEAAKGRHVNFWTSPHDLASKATLAIMREVKTHPRIGWIRADQAMDARTVRELERLRRENEQLRATEAASLAELRAGASELACEDETVPGDIVVRYRKEAPTGIRSRDEARAQTVETRPLGLTWREVFAIVGTNALDGMSEWGAAFGLGDSLKIRIRREHAPVDLYDLHVEIPDELTGRIKTQFMALGWLELVRPSGVRGSAKWWLTDAGRSQLVALVTIRKTPQASPRSSGDCASCAPGKQDEPASPNTRKQKRSRR
jgi:hypothetical protein